MATENLSLATVISSAWTDTGAAGLACVNTSDADTTFITTNSALVVQEYGFAAPVAIGGSDVISNVRLAVEARKTAGTMVIDIKAVVGANASAASSFTTTTSYVVYTNDFPLNPTGGAWTLANLGDLRIRLQNSTISLGNARVTYIPSAVVTYTAGAGGSKATRAMVMGVG